MTSEEKHFVVDIFGSSWRYVVSAMLARVAQYGAHSTQGYATPARCYTLAKLHPQQLEMGVQVPIEVAHKPDEVVEAESCHCSLTHGSF
jgi:hypothetical protein